MLTDLVCEMKFYQKSCFTNILPVLSNPEFFAKKRLSEIIYPYLAYIHLSNYLSIYLSIYLSMYLSIYLSIYTLYIYMHIYNLYAYIIYVHYIHTYIYVIYIHILYIHIYSSECLGFFIFSMFTFFFILSM